MLLITENPCKYAFFTFKDEHAIETAWSQKAFPRTISAIKLAYVKKNTRISTYHILIIGNYNNHERLNESPVVCLVTDPIHNLVFIFFGCKGTTFFEICKKMRVFFPKSCIFWKIWVRSEKVNTTHTNNSTIVESAR